MGGGEKKSRNIEKNQYRENGSAGSRCAGQIHMLDMHAHLLCLSDGYYGKQTEREAIALGVQELQQRQRYGIASVFSCGSPQEWDFMERCLAEASADAGEGGIPPFAGRDSERKCSQPLSFGIHPWYSDRWLPGEWLHYFRRAPLIGEIGMDSVWTSVPLKTQRRVFAQQLEIAAELRKPVILHTKGQEMQIAEMIRDFPCRVCIHWYSGDEAAFEKFLEAGCYFTLGPDLAERLGEADGKQCSEQNRTESAEQELRASSAAASDGIAALYRRMLSEVPAGRLFLETDGVSSIAWMRGQEAEAISPEELPEVLERNLRCAAARKGLIPEKMQTVLWDNFRRFFD